MISDEEKTKIKEEIVEKINSVLEKNNESFRLDKVNVLNKNESVKFMGNYRVYDRKNYNAVSREINTFLKQYGDVDIKSKKIRDSGMKFTAVSFNFELWRYNNISVKLIELLDDEIPEFKRPVRETFPQYSQKSIIYLKNARIP